MTYFIIVALVIWLSALMVWWLVSNAFRKTDVDRIKNRVLGVAKVKKAKVAQTDTSLIQREESGAGRVIEKILNKFQLHTRLQDMLEQAGLKWNVARLIHSCLGMFLAGYAFTWLMMPPDYRQSAWLIAAGASTLPVLYVLRKRTMRLRRFEELFPESLEFVARSMRAGHAFSVSLEMIHREFQEPLSGEFKRAFEEHNLGLSLEMALQKMAKRVPSLDVHFFVSAVLLQKRTGGNLAEILDKLAYIIRDRFKLRGKIRAISAHGRITATVLTAIPAVVAILMFVVNPEYVSFFMKEETGKYMMGAALGLQVIGYLVMRKIVSIEV